MRKNNRIAFITEEETKNLEAVLNSEVLAALHFRHKPKYLRVPYKYKALCKCHHRSLPLSIGVSTVFPTTSKSIAAAKPNHWHGTKGPGS